MGILTQLGVDQTFFVQLAIFIVLFPLLSVIYFRPFQRLFEARHKKTVEDRKAAEDLLEQAKTKLAAYESKLDQARSEARDEYEKVLATVRKDESEILHQAREEVKKLSQEAITEIEKQRKTLKGELQGEIKLLARTVSDRLMSKKV